MSRINEAQKSLSTVYEMSKLLNTGLDKETLAILMNLCEKGVNPEALAVVVKELNKLKTDYENKFKKK